MNGTPRPDLDQRSNLVRGVSIMEFKKVNGNPGFLFTIQITTSGMYFVIFKNPARWFGRRRPLGYRPDVPPEHGMGILNDRYTNQFVHYS